MGAILYVMTMGLVRDRGALAMTFLLPPLIFVIFASVFAGAGSGDVRIRLALANLAEGPAGAELAATLRAQKGIDISQASPKTVAAIRRLVRRGTADVGLVIHGSGQDLRLVVLQNPQRQVAVALLRGHLRAAAAGRTAAPTKPPNLEFRSVMRPGGTNATVTYYAGGVAVLFLLFAAIQGALTLQEDRESGVMDRIVTGPSGIGALVAGKFAFIVLQGLLQVAAIFLVAWLAYGVPWPQNLLPWAVTTVTTGMAAAGLALLLTAACGSRRQALTLGNFLVLIVSAVGGSMIPRFLMPGWLQTAGWLTPNAWALDAYTGTFWRGDGILDLLPAWGVLAGIGLLALGAALLLARRFERV